MSMHRTEGPDPPPPTTAPACCPIVELRQYTLHPGMRDVLVELFDRELVETQEAVGMRVIGQFRDLDDPDRFVWLRGFPDMPARAESLAAFYGGPTWKAHREAANSTMVDSDDVLLLRPARSSAGFTLRGRRRPPRDAGEPSSGLIAATLYSFETPVDATFLDLFDLALEPALAEAGAEVLACLVTEDAANTFPALPVREGEHVFACFARFPGAAPVDRHRVALARCHSRLRSSRDLRQRPTGSPAVLRLEPTARSLLR
jgi:hypothetical protein